MYIIVASSLTVKEESAALDNLSLEKGQLFIEDISR